MKVGKKERSWELGEGYIAVIQGWVRPERPFVLIT